MTYINGHFYRVLFQSFTTGTHAYSDTKVCLKENAFSHLLQTLLNFVDKVLCFAINKEKTKFTEGAIFPKNTFTYWIALFDLKLKSLIQRYAVKIDGAHFRN